MRDLSDVSLKASDFEKLASLCCEDRKFPADMEGWQSMIAQATSDQHQRRRYASPLLLDVQEFAGWCARLSIVPCLDALRAFVQVKRHEVS